ncbi:MAG TPA: hypothetical protein VFE02_06805 [Candidatus Acidoferrales bacterium]|jgi:hypothetical protein|nr:hypothetical protein [Candidatus Acidoferrales bacterium]
MRGKPIPAVVLICLLACAGVLRADELRLKDGTKIIGTIVGFENDSFRVETSYGYALIRKDKVADINIIASKKDADPKAKSPVADEPATSAAPPMTPAVVREPASLNNLSSPGNAGTEHHSAPQSAPAPNVTAMKPDLTAPKAKPVSVTQVPPPAIAPASSLASSAPAMAAAPPTPPPAPEPLVIRDEIRGNQYVNLTYGFQMFKPPSWELIPGARKSLPDAVAALGTNDQTTLMVIGREHAKDSLDAHAAKTGKALGDVYENYRQISTRQLTVAGFPAVLQRARGTADGRDWSVTLLTLLKGNDAYTLLGMTWADSDLIQVQENVIAKAVNSFTFAAQ